MSWLMNSSMAVILSAGLAQPAPHAIPASQETPQAAKKIQPAAETTAAKSDPAALAFLTEKVDKVMYNIVTAGARTARGQMKVSVPMMGELEVLFQWRKDPWFFETKVKLPAQLLAMNNPRIDAMKKMIEGQMNHSAQDALLLPISSLSRHNIVTRENDGDLVKIIFKPMESGIITEAVMWFTGEGKLVRQRMAVNGPMGKMESTTKVELTPTDESAKTFLVTKTTANAQGMTSVRELIYAESNGFKVVDKSKESNAMGAQEVDFNIEVNVPLEISSPPKLEPKAGGRQAD